MLRALVIVVGLSLIVVGLYFARGGIGHDHATGGARGVTMGGPAWLLVVMVGVGLLLFGVVWDPSGDKGSADGSSTTSVGGSSTSCHRVVDDPEPPLNIRADPSASSKSIGSLENGESIDVVENRGEWLRITAPVDGWVFSQNTACR